MKFFKTIALAGVLGVVAFGSAGTAEAGYGYGGYGSYSHTSCHAPSYSLKKVVTYDYVKKPYKKRYVSYDHCGDIVVTYKIAYRTVRVPVVSYVKVWH